MNTKKKLIILIGVILCLLIFMFLIIKENPRIKGCPGDKLDLTEMLQFNEKVKNIKIKDRYGNIFDLDRYENTPVLFYFVKDNTNKIIIFNDTLKKVFINYIDEGLKIIYINAKQIENVREHFKNSETEIFYDSDSLLIFKALKFIIITLILF